MDVEKVLLQCTTNGLVESATVRQRTRVMRGSILGWSERWILSLG